MSPVGCLPVGCLPVGCRCWLLAGAVGLLLHAGCSDSGPRLVKVRGRVTYQGEPVTLGTVMFAATETGGGTFTRPGIGMIEEDGSYVMNAVAGRKGVVPGEYKVAIRSYTGSFMENNVVYIVPEKYFRPETSGLTASIPQGARATLEIDFHVPD